MVWPKNGNRYNDSPCRYRQPTSKHFDRPDRQLVVDKQKPTKPSAEALTCFCFFGILANPPINRLPTFPNLSNCVLPARSKDRCAISSQRLLLDHVDNIVWTVEQNGRWNYVLRIVINISNRIHSLCTVQSRELPLVVTISHCKVGKVCKHRCFIERGHVVSSWRRTMAPDENHVPFRCHPPRIDHNGISNYGPKRNLSAIDFLG